MGLYGAYFVMRGVDPMGLEGGNHWFPQSKRLQALLGKKCPQILEVFPNIQKFINLFTTPMDPVRKGNLHHAIHWKLNDKTYLEQVEDIYNTAKDCCELLKQMKDLILRVWAEAKAIVGPHPMLPPGMPDLMPYDADPWDTWQYLDEIIDVICNPKRRPRGEPDCPPLPVPDPKRYPKPEPLFKPNPRLPWMEPTWMEPNGGYRQPPNYFPLPPMEWPGVPGPELTPGQKVGCIVIIILAGGRLALRFYCPPTNLVPPIPAGPAHTK